MIDLDSHLGDETNTRRNFFTPYQYPSEAFACRMLLGSGHSGCSQYLSRIQLGLRGGAVLSHDLGLSATAVSRWT